MADSLRVGEALEATWRDPMALGCPRVESLAISVRAL